MKSFLDNEVEHKKYSVLGYFAIFRKSGNYSPSQEFGYRGQSMSGINHMDPTTISKNPKLGYIQLLYFNKVEESRKLNFDTIPTKLFRYQPVSNCRLKTLSKNELFLTHPYDFDDPYVSMGVFWNSQRLHNILRKKGKYRSIKGIDAFIEKDLLNNIRKSVRMVCFSENLDNLPLWGTYADKNKGFVVEYNFKQLGIDSDLTQYLYPVLYEPSRTI